VKLKQKRELMWVVPQGKFPQETMGAIQKSGV